MKRTILSLLAAAAILTGCNVRDDITKDLQEIENTNIDFSYVIDGQTVTFTNQSDDKVRKCFWDFGDNYASEAMHQTTHTYSKDGTYTVYLKASWIFNNHYLSKTCEKSITISSVTPQPKKWEEAYIVGFRLYKIPNDDYYYNVRWEATSFGDPEYCETDKVELFSSKLPYDYILTKPILLKGGAEAFKYYTTFTMYVYKSYYSWQTATQCLKQSKETYTGEMEGKSEYVFTSNNGDTQVAILFEYL